MKSLQNSKLTVACTGVLLLIASSIQAQNLFVTAGTNIIEVTPSGTQSTFFSSGSYIGLSEAFNSSGDLFVGINGISEITPEGVESTFASDVGGSLAFNSTGDLFVGDEASGSIYEYTPGGVRSIFASGLDAPTGLAFDSAGDLFEADGASGNIYEYAPDGSRTTFASGLNGPSALAFQPTPEPSSLWLVLLGSGVWFYVRRTHKKTAAR
jgi:PEP-CTERM motif